MAATLSQLIKAYGSALVRGGPRKAPDIQRFQAQFDVSLPSDYRLFLGNYGYLQGEAVNILGLTDDKATLPSIAEVTLLLRLTYLDMPLELVPIEPLGDELYACQLCPDEPVSSSAIVLYDPIKARPVPELTVLADSFTTYLSNRLIGGLPQESTAVADDSFEKAWLNFDRHVQDYQREHQYDHAKGGKLPRNHIWRPYRYCIQDVVFGVTVVRHWREPNCLEVDVFLTADIPEYGPLAGARALTHFLLSEAYKCGGTMEIRFTRNVEGGRIPRQLTELASALDVTFAQPDRLLPAEAKDLYAALTGFSLSLRAALESLEAAGRIKMARACYVVNHGVWSREQVELLVLGSERPDSILAGEALPQQRHLYYHDLLHARAALMTGMLERILLQRERESEGGVPFDLEDDTRQFNVTFDGQLYAKTYESEEPIPIPWLHGVDARREVAGGMSFTVFVRAHDVADLMLHLATDISDARAYREQVGRPVFVLVTHDFLRLPADRMKSLSEKASDAQVGLLVCPEEAAFFDQDAAQRLARSRVLRQ